ncbi:hypothetical protein EW146_g9975, partial [Bondarzewia mesenterica]
LDETVEDQRRVRTRWELRGVVQSFRDSLTRLRKETRTALLTSKRAIDAHSASKREELLRSSAMREKQGSSDRTTEDALMKANNDVTDALRRTMGLMQGELERSVLSVQMLESSTTTLKSASSTHDVLTNLLGSSKQLITALEKSDWLDRLLIMAALAFFVLVVLFILKQRVFDRSLRIAFWWTRFLPAMGGRGKRMVLEKAEEASVSLVEVMATAAHSLGAAGISSTVVMAAAATSSAISSALASSTSASFTHMKDEEFHLTDLLPIYYVPQFIYQPWHPKPRSGKQPRLGQSQTSVVEADSQLASNVAGVFAQLDSYLDRLPLELLSLILSFVASPKDVLAVARCNKHLCATLLNKANAFVWRTARKICLSGQLQAPPPGWSEPAFAAFVFDGGFCEPVCQHTAARDILLSAPHYSVVRDFIMQCIPRLEEHDWVDGISSSHQPEFVCRKSDWDGLINEYNRIIRMGGTAYDFLTASEVQRLPRMMLVGSYVLISSRGLPLLIYSLLNKRANIKHNNSGRSVSNSSLDHPVSTYCSLVDFRLLRTRIASEVFEITEKRKRQLSEHADQTRRADIARHYQRIKSAGTHAILPTLLEFRRLPVIKLLQSKDASSLESELKESGLVADLIRDDMKKWVEAARGALAKVLGYPVWQNLSKKGPASVPRDYVEAGSLDFRGACAHDCPNTTKEQKRNQVWSAENFIPDRKGIDVLFQVLALAGINDEDPSARHNLIALGPYFLCKSCDPPIAMDCRRLAGHSKRHDAMQVYLITAAEADSMMKYPYAHGSRKKLVGFSQQEKKTRSTKNFGCRHCLQTPVRQQEQVPIQELVPSLEKVAVQEQAPSQEQDLSQEQVSLQEQTLANTSHTPRRAAGTRTVAAKPRLFIFDGLISHLKEKYVIDVVSCYACPLIDLVLQGMELKQWVTRTFSKYSHSIWSLVSAQKSTAHPVLPRAREMSFSASSDNMRLITGLSDLQAKKDHDIAYGIWYHELPETPIVSHHCAANLVSLELHQSPTCAYIRFSAGQERPQSRFRPVLLRLALIARKRLSVTKKDRWHPQFSRVFWNYGTDIDKNRVRRPLRLSVINPGITMRSKIFQVLSLALFCAPNALGALIQKQGLVLPSSAAGHREVVKSIFNDSYEAYRKFAFGHDDLSPLSQSFSDGRNGWGASIVDAMSTMSQTPDTVSIFESTIRYVGGLLSAYELSGKKHAILVEKAKELADRLSLGWSQGNVVPFGYVDFSANSPTIATSNIAEAGSVSPSHI